MLNVFYRVLNIFKLFSPTFLHVWGKYPIVAAPQPSWPGLVGNKRRSRPARRRVSVAVNSDCMVDNSPGDQDDDVRVTSVVKIAATAAAAAKPRSHRSINWRSRTAVPVLRTTRLSSLCL